MSLRDLVTGSDMCTPSGGDGAGPSNAVGTLVHSLLGGASKAQEQLREVRGAAAAAVGCLHRLTPDYAAVLQPALCTPLPSVTTKIHASPEPVISNNLTLSLSFLAVLLHN